MARLLSRSSQTLTLHRRSPSLSSIRRRSTRPDGIPFVEVIEVDLASGDVSGSGAGFHRLEDAIQNVLVRRAAPDWLPFVPGASYWVPPMRQPHAFAELVGNLAKVASAAGKGDKVVHLEVPPVEEEMMAFTSSRGWPSSAYYFEGKHAGGAKIAKISTIEAQTDDEEN